MAKKAAKATKRASGKRTMGSSSTIPTVPDRLGIGRRSAWWQVNPSDLLLPEGWGYESPNKRLAVIGRGHFVTVDPVFPDDFKDAAGLDQNAARCALLYCTVCTSLPSKTSTNCMARHVGRDAGWPGSRKVCSEKRWCRFRPRLSHRRPSIQRRPKASKAFLECSRRCFPIDGSQRLC